MPESRSAKAIILASGQGLTTLMVLVIAAVLSRQFTKHDYATYRQTLLAYSLAAPFVMLGFNKALFYFLPTEKERPRGVLVENLILLGAGGLVLTMFLLCGGNELLAWQFQNPSLTKTLLVLAPYPLLMLPASALSACLLARSRATQVAVFNVVSRLGILVAVLVPCFVWPGWPTPTVAIAGTVLATCVTTTLALVLMFRACPGGHSRPTWLGFRRQIFFSVPLGMAGVVGALSLGIDKVLVSALCGPHAFAVFVNGAMEIPLVGVLTGSVTAVLVVEYAKLHLEGNVSEILGLIHRAMIKCALILIPAMCFLLCMAPEFMQLLYGKDYIASAIPFRIYLLMLPVRTVTFGAILMASGNSHHILTSAILSLVFSFAAASAGIMLFGPNGAAAGSVSVMYLVVLPYHLFVLRDILKCSLHRLFPWKDMLLVGVACGLPAPLVGWLKTLLLLPNVLVLLITGMIYLLVVLALFDRCRFLGVSKMYATLRALFHPASR